MKVTTTPVEVWSTEVDNEAGGLARTLRAITEFGVDLEYVQAERVPGKPTKGIVFVAPSSRHLELDRITDMGLRRDGKRALLKVEGNDAPGVGAKLARAIGEVGVNMKTFSAGVQGHRFIAFIEFDTAEDMGRAETALKALNQHPAWAFWATHSTAA